MKMNGHKISLCQLSLPKSLCALLCLFQRYMEAMHVYKEVLTLDKSCTDAAQELMKVQILQLMVSAGVSANEGMSVI